MQADWEKSLERWQNAGLVDAAAAEKIRRFENANPSGWRWPAVVALAFGGSMLGAGVLLFIAAHWDTLSPEARFALVLMLVAAFHAGGAWAARSSDTLAATLHAIGTASLGAAVFLTGQIFNFAQDWPAGVLLWACGAWIGYALRRDWVQFAFAAVLTPVWLAGQWTDAFPRMGIAQGRVLLDGCALLAITYFSARTREKADQLRSPLTWIGGIALLPCATALAAESEIWTNANAPAGGLIWAGSAIAFGLPLSLAWSLRRGDAWVNAVAAAWVWCSARSRARTTRACMHGARWARRR